MKELQKMFKTVMAEMIFNGKLSVENAEKNGKKIEIFKFENLTINLNAEANKRSE